MNIDEIALRVAEQIEQRGRTYSPDHYIDVVKLVLAELSKEEAPVIASEQNPPMEAIGRLLTEVMDIAASNGAYSRSMPDDYVEIAAWLCGIKPNPADIKQQLAEAFVMKFKRHVGGDGEFWLHELEDFCEDGKWREYL